MKKCSVRSFSYNYQVYGFGFYQSLTGFQMSINDVYSFRSHYILGYGDYTRGWQGNVRGHPEYE